MVCEAENAHSATSLCLPRLEVVLRRMLSLTRCLDHIVHQVCTNLALGASPDILRQNYRTNIGYQRPLPVLRETTTDKLRSTEGFVANMSQQKNYSHYLRYFTKELESKTLQEVVHEHVFKGDHRANLMFNRLFEGTYPPFPSLRGL